MASNGRRSDARCGVIVIDSAKAGITSTQRQKKRILKLDNTEFEIDESQIVAASNFLKRLLLEGMVFEGLHSPEPNEAKFSKIFSRIFDEIIPQIHLLETDFPEKTMVVALDNLKEKQPCFSSDGLAIAIAFAGGRVEIPFNRIISALAAANALQMWDMCTAISEQLGMLAAQPKTAPFAINVAACNLEKDAAKRIVKQSLGRFDEVIKQHNFPAISFSSFELFISLYIHEHSTAIGKQEKKLAAESVVRAVIAWSGSDKERFSLLKKTFDNLRPFCGSDIIDDVEAMIAPSSIASESKNSNRENMEKTEDVQSSSVKLVRATAGGSNIDSNEPLNFESIREIELPEVEPDANGIRHYSFVVEFETSKEYLFSEKPKMITLQLEAVLECPNQS